MGHHFALRWMTLHGGDASRGECLLSLLKTLLRGRSWWHFESSPWQPHCRWWTSKLATTWGLPSPRGGGNSLPVVLQDAPWSGLLSCSLGQSLYCQATAVLGCGYPPRGYCLSIDRPSVDFHPGPWDSRGRSLLSGGAELWGVHGRLVGTPLPGALLTPSLARRRCHTSGGMLSSSRGAGLRWCGVTWSTLTGRGPKVYCLPKLHAPRRWHSGTSSPRGTSALQPSHCARCDRGRWVSSWTWTMPPLDRLQVEASAVGWPRGAGLLLLPSCSGRSPYYG